MSQALIHSPISDFNEQDGDTFNNIKPGVGEAPPAGQNMEGGEQRAQPGLEGVWDSLVRRRRAHLNGGRRRRKSRGSLGAMEESVSRVLLSVQDKD